jgi:cell shape-determining protein MreC
MNNTQLEINELKAKIKSLEKDNEELNRQLQLAVSKYIDADSEVMALRRECARRG